MLTHTQVAVPQLPFTWEDYVNYNQAGTENTPLLKEECRHQPVIFTMKSGLSFARVSLARVVLGYGIQDWMHKALRIRAPYPRVP